MTPEQRIERFYEEHYPSIAGAAIHYQGLGMERLADAWLKIARDLYQLRHGGPEPIDWQI